MKFGLFAALILLAGCASSPPHSSGPNSRTTNDAGMNKNTFNRDMIDCERQAALAGAGGKGAAFASCMKARGHKPGR